MTFSRIHFRRLLAFSALFLLGGSLFAQPSRMADLLRRADTAFADENRVLAEELYRQVLALDPFQSRALFRMGQLARNDEDALAWVALYVEQEPADAWGWLALGDKSLKVGKTVEALAAFERAAKLEPKAEDVLERLAKGRLRAAPTFEPIGGHTLDSDLNTVWRYGLNGDVALRGGFRWGARLARSEIGDGLTRAAQEEILVRLEGRPRMTLRLDLQAGAARLAAEGQTAWLTPEADLRLRWGRPDTGLSFDGRLQRITLGTSPLLVAFHAVRNEARLSFGQAAGPLRIRAGGRAGFIEARGERPNLRLQGDAAVAIPLAASGEISIQYHRLGFKRRSDAGYFAPKLVETIEAGSYWEWSGEGRLSAALDLGAGAQRLAKQKEPVGPWKPALRAWAWLAVDLAPTMQLRFEGEGYSAPFAPAGVATAPDWRYGSISLGLLVRVR
jgi:tetratricopeptide (TPR) repeat protein